MIVKNDDKTNKNANNKVDISYNIWLGERVAKITFVAEDVECDVQETRDLLDGRQK